MKRPDTPKKILFIGNSFTARNDLPGQIAQMAAARGKPFKHRLINVGGASLRQHWNGAQARAAIESGGFDTVVLQEQSTLPVKNAQRMRENVRLFDPAIKSAGARMVLYLTWARSHAPESQKLITDAYTQIGEELGAAVVPVGIVWEKFLRQHDKPVLHDRDQSHPSPAGSYLAACVFLVALFGENPTGIGGEVKGVNEEDRAVLQAFAWQNAR